MKRKKISNEKLDSIGTLLLEAGRLTPDDIDQIEARPGLFAGVRRGIEVERSNVGVGSEPARSWRWGVMLAPVMSSMIVVAALYAGLISFNRAPVAVTTADQPTSPPVQNGNVGGQVSGETAVARRSVAARPATRIKRAAYRPRVERSESTGDFYALTYDNNLDADVRLIRAELPRSSLIAMGLNIHLENGNDKVQTDLLVGADGVPRAIRIVK